MLELLECWDNNMHTCPTPMTFPLMFSTSPYPPSQPLYLMPIPPNLPFPTTGCLKFSACKKGMLLLLWECYSDGRGSLSGLLSLIKSWCLWRSWILSQYVSFLLLHFPFIWWWNPRENSEWGKCPSWVTVILWQSSYGQWCTLWGLWSRLDMDALRPRGT
jgi:hypothetical protein